MRFLECADFSNAENECEGDFEVDYLYIILVLSNSLCNFLCVGLQLSLVNVERCFRPAVVSCVYKILN